MSSIFNPKFLIGVVFGVVVGILSMAQAQSEPQGTQVKAVSADPDPKTYEWTLVSLRLTKGSEKLFETVDAAKDFFGAQVELNLSLNYLGREITETLDVEMGSLRPMLSRLALTLPSELAAKKFTATYRMASYAFDEWKFQNILGASYKKPTNDEIYNLMASSFSLMECPRFESIEKGSLVAAFSRIFHGEIINGTIVDIRPSLWFEEMSKALSTSTADQVKIVAIDADQYKGARIRGEGIYFELSKGSLKRQGFIGPYSTPVTCLPYLP